MSTVYLPMMSSVDAMSTIHYRPIEPGITDGTYGIALCGTVMDLGAYTVERHIMGESAGTSVACGDCMTALGQRLNTTDHATVTREKYTITVSPSETCVDTDTDITVTHANNRPANADESRQTVNGYIHGPYSLSAFNRLYPDIRVTQFAGMYGISGVSEVTLYTPTGGVTVDAEGTVIRNGEEMVPACTREHVEDASDTAYAIAYAGSGDAVVSVPGWHVQVKANKDIRVKRVRNDLGALGNAIAAAFALRDESDAAD